MNPLSTDPTSADPTTTEQILLGLEKVYPDRPLLSRTRFILEKLRFSEQQDAEILRDFFEILKAIGPFGATPSVEQLVLAETPQKKLEALLRLFSHLSYNILPGRLKVLLKFFELPEKNESACESMLLVLLDEQGAQQGYEYCLHVKELIVGKTAFAKMRSILDFYLFLYEDEHLCRLKRAFEQFVSQKSGRGVFEFLHERLDLALLENIKELEARYPEARLNEAFSKGQVLSKKWACRELKKVQRAKFRRILVLCGWYGSLAHLLFESFPEEVIKIRSVDVDESCLPIADFMNRGPLADGWRFKAATANIHDLDYSWTKLLVENEKGEVVEDAGDYDLIVNTSCEHIERFAEWYEKIPTGKRLLLQSNDFFECEEHVNCVRNLHEFAKMAPMSTYLYMGRLKLEKYTRFMLIGYK